MLRKTGYEGRTQVSFISLDELVPNDHLRHTEVNKSIYARRKETIERVFADMKEKHGLRWTTLRGLKKVSIQAMLIFAAMNLKKLATWLWRAGGSNDNNACYIFIFPRRQNKLLRFA